MGIDYLTGHIWFALAVISLFYLSDYFLTRKQARLYANGAKDHIEIEGGIELNPVYREEMLAPKRISKRFVLTFIIINVVFYLFWSMTRESGSAKPFEFLLGSWILVECFIHSRHLRTYPLYAMMTDHKTVTGKINYSRGVAHKLAAIDARIFALFYFFLLLLTGRVFFLGGAFTCLVLAHSQKKWLKKSLSQLKANRDIQSNPRKNGTS